MSTVRPNRFGLPSLVALLLAVLWVLAGYRAHAERGRVLAAKEAELNQLVVAVEQQTLRLFRLAETSLLVTSRWIEEHPGVYPGQDPAFIGLVGNLKRLSDDGIEIRLIDNRGGAHVVPARSPEAVISIADSRLFRVQRDPATRGFFIGDPVIGRISAQWIVPVSYPVRSPAQPFIAVVAAIQLERIARPLETQRQKPNGSITLLQSSGMTLLRTPAIEGAIGKSIAQAPDFIEHLSARPRGLYRVKGAFDGVERMVGHAHLADYPIIIAVTASVDDALRPWWRDLYQLLAFVVAVSGFALFFTQRWVRAAREAQQKLTGSEQRFRTLIEHAPDAILVFDADDRRIVEANPMAERLFALTRDELLSGGIERFYAPVQPDGLPAAESILQAQERCFRGESVLVERRLRNASGKDITVEVRIDDLSEGGRRLTRGSFIDISERKTAEAELARIAHYDPLTNLPNRRLLTDRMEQAIARSRRKGRMLAVCYLDLDEFKPVNDRLGHEAGDQVLVEAARRMSEAIRAEDTAARLGGDEFVLLLTDLDGLGECDNVLARVMSSLATSFVLADHDSVVLSASIGVALFPGCGDTPDELLRRADQAMYAAKQAGRNRIEFCAPRPPLAA